VKKKKTEGFKGKIDLDNVVLPGDYELDDNSHMDL